MSTNETRLHTMQLMYVIDDHRRPRMMPAVEAPIDAKSCEEAQARWWFRQGPTPGYKQGVRYWMVGRMLYQFGSGDREELRSETRERRKWAIEFRNSGPAENNQLGIPFFCFFPSPYVIISLDLGPVQMASARVLPPPDCRRVEVEFPCTPDPPKGYRTVPIGRWTFELVPVCTWHDFFMLPSFSFPFSCTVYAAQEVCA